MLFLLIIDFDHQAVGVQSQEEIILSFLSCIGQRTFSSSDDNFGHFIYYLLNVLKFQSKLILHRNRTLNCIDSIYLTWDENITDNVMKSIEYLQKSKIRQNNAKRDSAAASFAHGIDTP